MTLPDVWLAPVFGIVAVVIAGAFSGFLELFRITLDGRAAVRIVRFEMLQNTQKCMLAISHGKADLDITDSAWLEYRTRIGQILPEDAFLLLNTGYGAIFLVQEHIHQIQGNPARKDELSEWCRRMANYMRLLALVERRHRAAQMLDLILGRQTWPGGSHAVRLAMAAENEPRTDEDRRGRALIDQTLGETFGVARPDPSRSSDDSTGTEGQV